MENSNADFSIVAEYYSRHCEELKAFVVKRIQNVETSEDIVQNVFLRLMSSDKMITPVTLPCLVYTVARNLIYDYWRHYSYIDRYEHYIKGTMGGNACSDDNPQSVYSAMEMNELLERGIARLSERKQNIYRMNIYEGMQVSEISQMLNMNYKSVENRLGDARREVRQYMRRALA